MPASSDYWSSWADAWIVPKSSVLAVTLHGVHTGATLRALREEIGAAWGAHCTAYVLDYRRCILAATDGEIEAMQDDEWQNLPAAVICSDAQWETFLPASKALARRGVLRVPFVCEASAYRWALVCSLAHPLAEARQSPRQASPRTACADLA